MIKLNVEIVITDTQARQLSQNSIERVHNTAKKIICKALDSSSLEDMDREDASVCEDDLTELGPLANYLWAATRNAVFIHNQKTNEG